MRNILIIEDDKILNKGVAFALKKEGYNVISARSEERRVGKECLRLCRSRWSPYH